MSQPHKPKLKVVAGEGEKHRGIFGGLNRKERRQVAGVFSGLLAAGVISLVLIGNSQKNGRSQSQEDYRAAEAALKREAKQAQQYVKATAKRNSATFTPDTGEGVDDVIRAVNPKLVMREALYAAMRDYVEGHDNSDSGLRNDRQVTVPQIDIDEKTGYPLPLEVDGKKYDAPIGGQG
jgi:type II secretory pathway pseudopilin PulG